jgi:plastocyanin
MLRLRLVIFGLGLLSYTACGGGYDSPTAPTPQPSPSPGGSSVSVAISQGAQSRTTDAFGANPLTVSTGSTVVWMNSDNATHNATANGGTFATGSITPGGQGSFTFTTAGTFPYHCTIHPNMVGTIVVQ